MPTKLNIRTVSENYPIIIGSNIIKNLGLYLNKNSIFFNQCLLVIDKKVPKKMISKINKALKERKYLNFYLMLMKKTKI